MIDSQHEMFSINGVDKLSLDSVKNRNQIIEYYANHKDALYFVSHSGGRDSQACYERVKALIPSSQIVVIHATLGDYEYDVIDFIKDNIDEELYVVKDENRSLLENVILRGKWFGFQQPFCTSSAKTNPIDKILKRIMAERGVTVGFNCLGLRAAESNARFKKNPLYINKRLTTTGKRVKRTVYDFYPVFEVQTVDEIWDIVSAAGKEIHPVYGTRENRLNSRLSCRICFQASIQDKRYGALSSSDMYFQYLAVERVIGHTMVFTSKQRTIKTERVCIITGKTLIDKRVEKTIKAIPLNEHLGLPFDELAVQRYVKLFTKKRAELLAIKANTEAERLANRLAKIKPKHTVDENQLSMLEA